MKLSREKHLDHMVRVVPLIVMGYAIQCYIIGGMNTPIGGTALMVLGAMLVTMIAGFIIHDVKNVVELNDETIRMTFLGRTKEIRYTDIFETKNSSPQHTFGTILIRTKSGNHKFYFIDEADKVKTLIDQKRIVPEEKKAA